MQVRGHTRTHAPRNTHTFVRFVPVVLVYGVAHSRAHHDCHAMFEPKISTTSEQVAARVARRGCDM